MTDEEKAEHPIHETIDGIVGDNAESSK